MSGISKEEETQKERTNERKQEITNERRNNEWTN